MPAKPIDLMGRVFGRLEVLKYVGAAKWECKCNCGQYTLATGGHLR